MRGNPSLCGVFAAWRSPVKYSYNLAGERLSQHSVWEDGGNAFEYRLDASGRLIRESINRFVCDGVQDFAEGVNAGTAFALDGKLRLLARDDDFSATYLDLQRWEIAISEPVATSVSMVQNDGLRWRTSVGETLRNGRVLPAGTPIDSSNVASDYPHIADVQVADTVGWFEGRMLLRHRMPLTGAFDVQIALSDFDVFGASIGLGVTRDRFETADGANRFPTDLGGVIDANGCDIVVEKDTDFLARFNDEELAGITVQKLRLKRFLDGSDWKLAAHYHDGSDWVTDAAWVGVVDDQELFAYLSLSGKVGYLRWSDFLDTVGDPYPLAGSYESRVYDAGRSVDFTRISWNEVCPTGTDVSFQVAVSEDVNGPWSYGSALTTAAGTTITSTTGRYARFKVSMTSDGSDTPVVNDVQVTHDGTSGSRVTRWTYDEAGNITEQARVTDAGTETDSRSYNNLNQLETSSGGWTYQYDPDGNLIVKDNGHTEGCERWEFTWNENCRLVQVKKGVYDATPTLVNEFQVDYQYDEMGRMLRRDDGTDLTTYCWDGWDCVRETTGEFVTEYLVPCGVAGGFIRDGMRYNLHLDSLGSVRQVTDSEGGLVSRREFDAFGAQIEEGAFDSLPGGLEWGFLGGVGVRTDLKTGLLYCRQRWFSPISCRFISRDGSGLSSGANLYRYCNNDPVNSVDPRGMDGAPPGWTPTDYYSGKMPQEPAAYVDDPWLAHPAGTCYTRKQIYELRAFRLDPGGAKENSVDMALMFMPMPKGTGSLFPVRAVAGVEVKAVAEAGVFAQTESRSRIGKLIHSFLVKKMPDGYRPTTLMPVAPAGAKISLEEAAALASRNGMDMRMLELRAMESSPGLYGSVFVTRAGKLLQTSKQGRFVIGLTKEALACPQKAVETIAHELNHIRGFLKTGEMTPEQLAIFAERMAGRYFRR